MRSSSLAGDIRKGPRPTAGSQLPPFAQWQAKQMSSRDTTFGMILLTVYIIYLYKTVPELCGSVATSSQLQPQQQNVAVTDKQQQWPVLWSLVCDRSADAAAKLAPAWRPTAAMRTVVATLQGLAAFFCTGLLSGDLLHFICGPLRLSFLWLLLLPFPYIDPKALLHPSGSISSRRGGLISWYHPNSFWQRPTLRSTAVALQRIVPPALMLTCSCIPGCRVSWYAAVQKTWGWHLVGKHAFQGWVAWMLALPLRAHIVVNLAEWLVNYTFFIKSLGPSSSSNGSGDYGSSCDLLCLCVSVVFVIIIPTCGVIHMERAQKRRYRQLQSGMQDSTGQSSKPYTLSDATSSSSSTDPTSGLQAPTKEHKLDPKNALLSSSTGSRATPDSSSLKNLKPRKSASARSRGVGVEDTCYDTSISGVKAAVGLSTIHSESDSSSDSITTSTDRNTSSSRAAIGSSSSDTTEPLAAAALAWMPAVRSLLGADAADVAAAAAGDALSLHCQPYESMVASLSVGVKVHCSHSNVSALGPLLTSALHYQLSPYNTAAAPLAISTACFRGSVQLIASIMGLKCNIGTAAATARDGSAATTGGSSSAASSSALLVSSNNNSSSRSFAAALLDRVQQSIQTWGRAATAAAGAGSNRTSALSQAVVDVAVGGSVISSAANRQGDGSSGSSSAMPQVMLRSIDPVCLVADQDQNIRLRLELSGPQQQQQQQQDAAPSGSEEPEPDGLDSQNSGLSGSARLLFLRDGQVVLDDDVSLTDLDISMTLPAQKPGVIHLVLLPGKKPAAAAEAAGDAAGFGHTPNTPGTAQAPLLLQPLVVLPATAAADLLRYHQQLLLPADSSSGRAWQSVSALALDMAYIMTTCASTAAAAANSKDGTFSKQQMPAGVQMVLKELLVHLAACGMWGALAYLVESASEVFIAADTSQDTSSSSSGSSTMIPAVAPLEEPCSCSHANTSSKGAHDDTDMHQASRPADVSKEKSSCSSSAISSAQTALGLSSSVTSSELLWGFKDPALEARYQVAAFSSSGFWDLISLAFTASMSLGFYFRKQNGHADTAEEAAGASGFVLGMDAEALSDWLFAFAYLCGPLPVLLLRIQVAWQLQKQQQDATAVLIRAAAIKQQLLLFWMAIMPVLLAVFAVSDVLATPAWVVRVWSVRSRSQDIGCVFAVAIKGLTGQIPFAAFWPIITAQAISCVIGSIKYGLRPHYWLAMRYVPMMLLPTVLAARQHIQGRRAFCAGQRIIIN